MVSVATRGQTLLTAKQAGEIIGLQGHLIRKLACRGEIVATRINSRVVRFAPEDIDAFIERHRVGGAPQETRTPCVKIVTPRNQTN